MNDALRRFGIINLINQDDLPTLNDYLHESRVRVFYLDGSRIEDRTSFFNQAARDLPQGKGLIANGDWDALSDSLWFGLSELKVMGQKEDEIAFVWTDAHRMLRGGLSILISAIDCFTDLARAIYTTEHGFPRQTVLRVFLVGSGVNFPSLSYLDKTNGSLNLG